MAKSTCTTRHAGKIVMVTGAASGLGHGIAKRFIAEGAYVICTDIDQDGVTNAAEGFGPSASAFKHDISISDDWQRVLASVTENYGRLDTLINNAGVTLMGSVEDIDIDSFDRTLAINLRGPFLGCRLALPLMKDKGGAIVNISSVSSFKPQAELVAYNASKAGVALMTKSIALHCAKSGYGIRVNSINPGVIQTAMLDKVIGQVDDGEALMDSYKAMHPIGRIGQPEEIASMASYLASDEAAFITGSAFTVDGGLGL